MDRYLQVFVTVVEKKNFSRAAEALHMTQPAVSQSIRTLEENIGIRLMERNNKYVQLNKAGDIVYHHAKEILGLYTKMQHLVDDLTQKAKGILAIGASYTFGEYVLPHILTIMQQKYPEIEPTVTIANTMAIADLVTRHQLDIGIVEGGFKDTELIGEKVAEDHMVIVASSKHKLAQKGRVCSNELKEEMWIIREQGSGTREATEKMLAQLHFKPRKTLVFSSTQPIKEAVEAGLGISMLSKWAIQKELHSGMINILSVQGMPFKRNFSIIMKSPFQTKALEIFIDMLRKNEILTDK